MKVIGLNGRNKAICEVDHRELEKFMDNYYKGKIPEFEVGQEIDLAKGHDFRSEIETALKKTRDFLAANKSTVKAITDGILLTGCGKD